MIKASEYYEFRFHKLHKTWRKGESPPSLKIYAFPSDKTLCVVAVLDCYKREDINLERKKSSFSMIS